MITVPKATIEEAGSGCLGFCSVWRLTAYDENNNVIYNVERNFGMSGNAAKFKNFKDTVESLGYRIKSSDEATIKYEMSL